MWTTTTDFLLENVSFLAVCGLITLPPVDHHDNQASSIFKGRTSTTVYTFAGCLSDLCFLFSASDIV